MKSLLQESVRDMLNNPATFQTHIRSSCEGGVLEGGGVWKGEGGGGVWERKEELNFKVAK